LKYLNVVEGKFISRPNRFIANVLINEKEHICHVKNTGRCRELLVRNAVVYLEKCRSSSRKTSHSLITVQKGERFVNIDSQAPNKVFLEGIKNGIIRLNGLHPVTFLKPEKTFGESRFDFYMESGNKRAFVEVKGVTLEEDGIAKFPDAPTERGLKHINELVRAKNEGYDAWIVFVIQMDKIKYFKPNNDTHPAFGKALRYARDNGVNILACECSVGSDIIKLNGVLRGIVL